MDVRHLPILCFILICSALVAVKSQETVENSTDEDVDIDFTTRRPRVTTPFPLNCTTAQMVEGVCTVRTSCDYGTPVVDKTLYKPSWYQSLCAMEEVCCPFDSLLATPPKPDNGAISSTDDDENF